ncbi:MAG: CBS domain-containing protein [Thermoflexaceae bacterium]|nr:CBS domain-containing protein [Thermoflexaceae bacterium]
MKLESVLAAKGPQVFTTPASASIGTAIAALARNNIGALIVVDEAGIPFGILSERDIIRHFAAADDPEKATVGDWMASPVMVASPADDAEAVLRTMTSRRFRHMPVVESGRLVGMVTIGDLVKAQLNEYRGAVETLETQLMDA